VPVEPSDTFDVIAKEGLAGQGAWLGFDYRTFFSDQRRYTLGQLATPDANDVATARRRLTEYVPSLNGAIEQENRTFHEAMRQMVNGKKLAIRAGPSIRALTILPPRSVSR
jgi:hypothetical protein